MQKMTPAVIEKPVVKEGPKIAFTVKKTPYVRPSTATTSTNLPNTRNLKRIPHQLQKVSHLGSPHPEPPTQQHNTTVSTSILFAKGTRQNVVGRPVESKEDGAGAMDVDSQPPPAQIQVETKKPRKPKTKRPPKVHFHCLLSSLFKTTISSEAVAASRSTPSTAGYPAPPTKGRQPYSNAKKMENHQSRKPPPFATPTNTAYFSTISSNESEAADEKIENWYITYKAHLEPETRRLMVISKPTTMRHQSQLKTMRKHHWECKTEIEQQLKRNVPTAFSLKIAFEMDIQNPHLPVIGTTLCALLEHKDIGGLACEELLKSWGLTGIDARRFTSHLWEIMVAAAGEAPVRGGKGFGIQVRQLEDKEDFKITRARLLALNKAPT
ncbi:hypothetical protein BGX24_004062 [Mortierella sp. AD032]|nr:hypothetical protein BGX24_004062 [Mortierella sp. AD032]